LVKKGGRVEKKSFVFTHEEVFTLKSEIPKDTEGINIMLEDKIL